MEKYMRIIELMAQDAERLNAAGCDKYRTYTDIAAEMRAIYFVAIEDDNLPAGGLRAIRMAYEPIVDKFRREWAEDETC